MIRKDIKEFLNTLPKDITLVAATKYGDVDDLKELYSNGVFDFGENRVDAFLNKYEALKDLDIKWHFIGHLQRNKAHLVLDKIDYLHSLDSLELVKMINKYRLSPLNCFVEVSINLEENKNGVPYYEVKDFIKECLKYPNVNIVGLMMMAVANSSEESLHNQFRKLKELKDNLEQELNISLPYLSMGMSDDYKIAIEEGATHIRLGRVLFNQDRN
jgi:pyridoxal phosphate enzyme (YggS family)